MGLADFLKSEAGQDLLEKGKEFVKENATEEGIEALIEKCKEMGLADNEIVAKLIDKFDLAKDVAEKYLTKKTK